MCVYRTDGKFYLIGGKGDQPTNVYDPTTNTWSQVSNLPLETHHLQPVVFDDKIYLVDAMTGKFLDEMLLPNRIWGWSKREVALVQDVEAIRMSGTEHFKFYNGNKEIEISKKKLEPNTMRLERLQGNGNRWLLSQLQPQVSRLLTLVEACQ